MEYYSQFQQDKYLDENIFRGKENGIFLDIGAYDGVTISNTYFFEKYRNWSGICVEPLPNSFQRLYQNRRSLCINAAVTNYAGKIVFQKINGALEMLSCIHKNDPGQPGMIDQKIAEHGGTKEFIIVDCLTINDILNVHNYHQIDYCSLDIEGGEYEVLTTINFNQNQIQVFTIENNYGDPRIRQFMESQNYCFIGQLGVDELYQHN